MIRLDRFSPLFEEAARHGLADVTPIPSYRYIYSLPQDALDHLAYFFAFRYREPRDVSSYAGRLYAALCRWQRASRYSDLFSVDTGDALLLWDLRPTSRAVLTILHGAERVLYQACDAASDSRSLVARLAEAGEAVLAPEAVAERLQPLVDRGLLLRDGCRYLALAIPLGEDYSPLPRTLHRFHELLQTAGTRERAGWVVMPDDPDRRAPAARACRPRRTSRAICGNSPSAKRLARQQFTVTESGGVLVRDL